MGSVEMLGIYINAILKGDIVVSTGSVEMLGIDFRSTGHQGWWRHCEANRNKWTLLHSARTLRELASLVGIAFWDWAVSGGNPRRHEAHDAFGGRHWEVKCSRPR